MGLAASQVRLLQLTCRKSDISRELQHLSNQKMSLTRDMQAVSREYQQALSAKSMKWSTNSGVSYTDINYNTLMQPNANNMKSPILVTDTDGRVVVNTKYQKYAEMISPNGMAGGTWSGDLRTSILSELTGISEKDINSATQASNLLDSAASSYIKAREDLEDWLEKERMTGGAGTKYLTIDKFAENLGSVGGRDLSKLYKQGENGDYHISSKGDIKSLINGIKSNMSKYFVDDAEYLGISDKTEFEKACDATYKDYETIMEASGDGGEKSRALYGIKGSSGSWTIDISMVFKSIMEKYVSGDGSYSYNNENEKTIPLRDSSSSAWKNWYSELKKRTDAFKAAETEYTSTQDSANQVMTADQETMMDYYDDLFISIADNGWVYDSQIDDNEYLNQQFQNNHYCVATITRNSCYDESQEETDRNWDYEYETSLASNFENIFSVSNSDAANKALAEYESKKSFISEKESRIDVRMKNLETEQSAIQNMIESIKNVKNENIDRTFNLWS